METTPRAGLLLVVTCLVLPVAACSTQAGRVEPDAASAPSGLLQLRDASGDPSGDLSAAAAPALASREQSPLAVVVLRPPAASPPAAPPVSSGTAVITAMPDRSELCVEISVAGLAQPTAAHLREVIGEGPGEVVLALKAPPSGDGMVDACVNASPRLLERLQRAPGRFAISVHTVTAPDGALRGQLR